MPITAKLITILTRQAPNEIADSLFRDLASMRTDLLDASQVLNVLLQTLDDANKEKLHPENRDICARAIIHLEAVINHLGKAHEILDQATLAEPLKIICDALEDLPA